MAGKLPADAFAFYVALGEGRSYAVVASNFGVSKAAVANRAKAEDWQQRVEAIDSAVRATVDASAVEDLAAAQAQHIKNTRDLHRAVADVITPDRLKALIASLLKEAVQGNVTAAKALLERVLGRPRSEPLSADALSLPGGLQSASDVRAVANAILQAVASGVVTPEDAQRTATVVESARRAIETEEMEQRLTELERRYDKETSR